MIRSKKRNTFAREPSRTSSRKGSWIVFAMSEVRISRSRTNHWSVNLSTSGMTAYAMAASVMARGRMNRSDSLMETPVGCGIRELRSEERRVGKEDRDGGGAEH